jgi:hypothetical protein
VLPLHNRHLPRLHQAPHQAQALSLYHQQVAASQHQLVHKLLQQITIVINNHQEHQVQHQALLVRLLASHHQLLQLFQQVQ